MRNGKFQRGGVVGKKISDIFFWGWMISWEDIFLFSTRTTTALYGAAQPSAILKMSEIGKE